MRDKFGEELFPGDQVVYAVREFDTAALRFSLVSEVFPDKVKVRTQGGEGPTTYVRMPERIVSLSAIEHKGYCKGQDS